MIQKRFCPKCQSENVEPLIGIGGFTGMFKCKNCNFSGQFPIKEIKGRNKK